MYNKKVLSEATKNLDRTVAPAKKKDKIVSKPVVSTQGYKQGPPPTGSHYRIPGDGAGTSIYNPTPYPLNLIGPNGTQAQIGPWDTNTQHFDEPYMDEFPMAAYGGDISIPDLNQYEDGGEYDLTDDEIEQLKKGGYIVEHLPSLPKKKGSKAYSRSLTATNKLFAQNPLLKKPKSKKNKIFDPQAKQFEKGGFQDDLGKHRQLLRDWTYGQSIGMLQKAQFGMNFKNRIKKVYNQEPTYSTNPQLAQFLNPEYQRVTEGPEVTVGPSSAQLLLNDANKRAEVANKNQKYTYTDPVSNQTIEYDSKQDFINKHKGNLLTGKTVINQGDEIIPALGSALEFTGVPAGLRTLDRLKEDPLALAKNVGTTAYDLAALPQNLVYEGANYLFGDDKFNLPIDTEALGVTADAASLLPFVQGTSRAIKQGAKMIGTESGLLSNAYKVNPLAGRLGEYNRVVGQDAIDDIVESGLVRVNDKAGVAKDLGPFGIVTRTTPYPSFGKAKPQQEYINQVISQGKTPYVISTDRPMRASTLGRHGKGKTQFPIDDEGKYISGFPASEAKVYEGTPHWLRGYKDVSIPPQEMIDLWRIQEKGARPMAELAAEGKLGPMFQNEKAIQHFKDREKYFGQWFTKDKNDFDFYKTDREFIDPEIIQLKVPKNKLQEFQNYDKSLSRASDREFVIPSEQQELYRASNTPVRSGIGGMDMSRYEIKNPDYFKQLLDTYDSKALSPTNKKFYKDLIESVKKQEGLVTERQYNELQRLKSGNFNFGKKAYDEGGYIEVELTPQQIKEYRDGGYIVDELD